MYRLVIGALFVSPRFALSLYLSVLSGGRVITPKVIPKRIARGPATCCVYCPTSVRNRSCPTGPKTAPTKSSNLQCTLNLETRFFLNGHCGLFLIISFRLVGTYCRETRYDKILDASVCDLEECLPAGV